MPPRNSIIDHQITDLASFETVTKDDSRQLAGLYFFMVLDRLVYLAEWLSHDVFGRPDKYSDLEMDEIELLANLHAKIGNDLVFPSREQREQIYVPVFGLASSASADFPRLRDRLMEAAANFANRQANEGVDPLIRGFRTALRTFNDFLNRRAGSSIRFSRDPILSTITEGIAYPILRSDKVASAWGYATEPTADWPYTDESPASELVDEMFEYFSNQMQPAGSEASTSTRGFAELQEVALRGAEAIANCIDVNPATKQDQIEVLIAKVYAWHVALAPQTQPV